MVGPEGVQVLSQFNGPDCQPTGISIPLPLGLRPSVKPGFSICSCGSNRSLRSVARRRTDMNDGDFAQALVELDAELEARSAPKDDGCLGDVARGLAYFGRAPSEHEHRLALERSIRAR